MTENQKKHTKKRKYIIFYRKNLHIREKIFTFAAIFRIGNMITKENIYSLSNAEIIQSLGAQFKAYRLNANMTQKEVADKAGVSLITLRSFETGKATNINMNNLLSLLRVINNLDGITEVLPEIPISPYLLLKLQSKQRKRAKHGK